MMADAVYAVPLESNQDRKTRLLHAAIIEFSRRGLAGARIDSIAKAAGANKQLLYHYFGDKEQLGREVMAEVTRLHAEEDALYPELKTFKAYQGMHCRRTNTRPLAGLWGRLLAWEALEYGAEGSSLLEERCGGLRDRFLSRVREAQDSGEIDASLDPNMVALAISAIELIPQVLPNFTRMITGYNGDEAEFTDLLVETLDGILGHLAPESSYEVHAAPAAGDQEDHQGQASRVRPAVLHLEPGQAG